MESYPTLSYRAVPYHTLPYHVPALRYKSQLTDAQAQESRLLPFQHRVEELTQVI